ncbi:inorganic phosphate transporter [Halobaculum lipolyticum]|uniref:Phosphate transporter n=1 Tax=Halobaculum lipolyticum TaxID=3032001 RepID=A0ABD5WGS0_9EURY|nr:inorganic phosphate transporter [Halobaculum sp. DT31]
MVEVLLLVGLLVAVFVGFNIGGSSTGVSFGPAVGSGTLSKTAAAALMSLFALAGGWTVGREVIDTMGGEIVPAAQFTLVASVAVLFFVGLALLISNTFGVPASTSMTAVGAIAGLGAASGTLDSEVMLRIVGWWLVAPVVAFWICAMIGRYLYPYLDAAFAIDRSPGAVVELDGLRPRLADGTTGKELLGTVLVLVIACYMAFSAGASNAANAVAPLVGNGSLTASQGVLLAGGAIALGAFTIARRTLDTVGNDLTDLPLLAALIVEVVSASMITFLSAIGIPASLAVSATMSIVGLGWGRATRTTTIGDAVGGAIGAGDDGGKPDRPEVSVNALAAERASPDEVPRVGEEEEDLLAEDLFDPGTTGRVVFFWILTPSLSFAASYALFAFTPL